MDSQSSGVEELELRSSVESVERRASNRSDSTARMELFESVASDTRAPLLSNAATPLTVEDVESSRCDEDVPVAVS